MRDLVGIGAAALATLAAGRGASAATIGRVSAGGRRGTGVRYPIPSEDGAQIDRDNQVILVRWEGAVYAFALSCPHQNTALRWRDKDGRFQCPKHKSKYSPDGTFLSGRATRGMDRFAISREGDEVVVDLAVLHEQPDDPAAWDGAVVRLN
jgi:Rieske Fe-S protein